jgi:hypothetical protein
MSTTRRSLIRRLVTLLALTSAGTLALLAAYAGVHGTSGTVRVDTAPAILDVAAAQTALELADSSARTSLESDHAGLMGTGEEYRTQIAAADQSLSRASEGNVTGESGRRTLQTLAGLVTAYTGWIERADRREDSAELRAAYLSYAEGMLRRPDSGILPRLEALQDEQRQALARQVSFGPLQWLCWAAAVALFLALGWVLVGTQRFVRLRFRRRWNPWLAVATLLLALVLVPLALFTVQVRTSMEQSEGLLGDVVAQQQRVGTSQPGAADVGPEIRKTAEEVEHDMSGTRWRADLIGLIPVAGLLIGALVVRGLQPRIAEYRFGHR